MSVIIIPDTRGAQLSAECERLRKERDELAQQLDSRPRTEFVAVGWWDGTRAIFEPGITLKRGALLFRPVSGGASIGGETD